MLNLALDVACLSPNYQTAIMFYCWDGNAAHSATIVKLELVKGKRRISG